MLFAVLALIVVLLALPPLFFLLQASVYEWEGFNRVSLSLVNFRELLGTGQTVELVRNSLIYAAGSATLAIVLGTGLAWAVERTNAPLRGAVYVVAFVSFAIPGVIQVIGWILLFGPNAGIVNVWLQSLLGDAAPTFNIYSMAGMIVVEGFGWVPVVFLLMATPFQSMDPSLEEAAQSAGASRWTTFRRVTFTLARPSVLAALLLSFIRAIESFEVPAILGIPAGIRVLTTEIYLQIKSGMFPQYGRASAYAVFLLLTVSFLLVVYQKQTSAAKRFATITGKGFRPQRIDLGLWRYPVGALCLLLPLAVIAPVIMLAWASFLPFYMAPSLAALESFSLANYQTAINNPAIVRSVSNTLQVGIVTATAAMTLTILIAWMVVRTRIRGRGLLDGLTSLPLVIPGIVVGVATLRTFVNVSVPVYGTILILIFAYTLRALPYGMRFTHAGLLQIHSELEESAEISGATLPTRLRKVVLPLMVPAFAAGWIYIFLFCVRQLSVAVLLSGPRNEVIAVTIFNLWENGQVTELAALSVLTMCGVVAVASAFWAITRRFGLRT